MQRHGINALVRANRDTTNCLLQHQRIDIREGIAMWTAVQCAELDVFVYDFGCLRGCGFHDLNTRPDRSKSVDFVQRTHSVDTRQVQSLHPVHRWVSHSRQVPLVGSELEVKHACVGVVLPQ